MSGAAGGVDDAFIRATRPISETDPKERGNLRSGGARGPRTPRGDVVREGLGSIVMDNTRL